MRVDSNPFLVVPAVASPINELRRLASEFLEMERADAEPDEMYHLVLSRVYAMCAEIVRCEHAGIGREAIVDALRDVREKHAESPFVRRLQEWPRGYPGDFETVEHLCAERNDAQPESLAWYCERYALSRPIAQQHRNKVHHQAARIMRTLTEYPRIARIFSIACGSCPDFLLVGDHLASLAGEVWLNDSDADALALSARRLREVRDRVHIRPGNAVRVVAKAARSGLSFELVLAGGLFDYLPDKQAAYLIEQAYAVLAPGGVFYFTNIARGNPYRPLIEYFGDWFLIERSEEDVLRLCDTAGIARECVSIRRDESKLAMLIEVTRRSD